MYKRNKLSALEFMNVYLDIWIKLEYPPSFTEIREQINISYQKIGKNFRELEKMGYMYRVRRERSWRITRKSLIPLHMRSYFEKIDPTK